MKLLSTRIRGIPLHYLLESKLMPAVNCFYQALKDTSLIEHELMFVLAFASCLTSIAGLIALLLGETSNNETTFGFTLLSGFILLILTVMQYIRARFASRINIIDGLMQNFHTIADSEQEIVDAIKTALILYAEEQLFYEAQRKNTPDADLKIDMLRKKRETLHKTAEALGMTLGGYDQCYIEAARRLKKKMAKVIS